jgi:phosphatidylethanolamine/phosphatidyl-N-methylethanolamine N-methyltransferase
LAAERNFLAEFLKHPRSVGAIAPSSRFLAKAICDAAELTKRSVVVEFGPGTGAFTSRIASTLNETQRYIGIEINRYFFEELQREFPQLTFSCTSVEKLVDVMDTAGIASIDAIICGLPWASLPIEVQTTTFRAMRAFMREGAVFCTFAYVQGVILPAARTLRKRLSAEFSDITCTPIIWRNFPPAFVYVCRR